MQFLHSHERSFVAHLKCVCGKRRAVVDNMYTITQVESSDEEIALKETARSSSYVFKNSGELTGRSGGMNRKMHEEYVTKTRSCLMTPIL